MNQFQTDIAFLIISLIALVLTAFIIGHIAGRRAQIRRQAEEKEGGEK